MQKNNKYTPQNHERCQPVLSRLWNNCIKTHDFPWEKYQPSSFECMCLCVRQKKPWIRTGPLHLVWLNSTKAAQRTADSGPLHSLWSSQRHATDGPEFTLSFSKTGCCGPLTYSICAAPQTLSPHADSEVAPQVLTHKATQWPSHFTHTKTRMTRPRSAPSSLLRLSRLFLQRWWMHKQTSPAFILLNNSALPPLL